jgi:FkbM family methyltransferase
MPVVRELAVSVVNRVPGQLATPFRSGSLLARTAAPLIERLMPKETIEVVVRSGPACGLRLRIDPQHEKYYWTGTYERHVQEAFKALLRPGDIVWDVGAHIGFFSLLTARLVGEGGIVHAFEPSQINRDRLETSLRLNDERRVRVHPFAVSGEGGQQPLYGEGSTASLAPNGGIVNRVECRTLDDLLAELGPPDFVKLDVEEVELDCLRGGIELCSRVRPILMIELHREGDMSKARRLLRGYELRPLSHRHWIARPRRAHD